MGDEDAGGMVDGDADVVRCGTVGVCLCCKCGCGAGTGATAGGAELRGTEAGGGLGAECCV